MTALKALSAATSPVTTCRLVPGRATRRRTTLSSATSRRHDRPTEAPEWLPSASTGRCPLPPSVELEHGACIERGEIAWELCGREDGPVVAVLGGISAHCHVTATSRDASPGWWSEVVGPGAALDTRRLRVLSFDYLGGNGGSTGPRTDGGKPFPTVTTGDQADALAALLDHLGIDRLAAVVGASYGGMVALAFAERHPDRVGRLIAISAADRSHPQATALRSVQRGIARLGLEHGASQEALALARGLAMVTYRSPAELEQRFDGPPIRDPESGALRFPVEGYLEVCGERFADRFDPHAFLCLSESLDLHRVDPGAIRCPTTLLSVRSDQLVPPSQLTRLARQLSGPCRLVEIDSIYGHDAFLKEVDLIGRVLHRSLIDLGTEQCSATDLLARANDLAGSEVTR